MTSKIPAAVLAALMIVALGSTRAAQPEENDALMIRAAKIDLARAVAVAERHAGGKASRAELEKHDGRWVFDVEVVRGHKVTDVMVAADDGRVVAATDDKVDRDDDRDLSD